MSFIVNKELFEMIGLEGFLKQGFLEATARSVQKQFPREAGQEVFFQVNFSISTRQSAELMEFIILNGISVRSVTFEAGEAEAIREALAEYAHENWSGMGIPYTDLPEEQKELARKEADRMLAIVKGG